MGITPAVLCDRLYRSSRCGRQCTHGHGHRVSRLTLFTSGGRMMSDCDAVNDGAVGGALGKYPRMATKVTWKTLVIEDHSQHAVLSAHHSNTGFSK